MKKEINIWLALIFMGIFFTLGGAVATLHKPKMVIFQVDEKQIIVNTNTELPYGWKIEVNENGYYTWVDDDSFRGPYPKKTKQEAINAAWSFFKYEKKREIELGTTWKTIEENND